MNLGGAGQDDASFVAAVNRLLGSRHPLALDNTHIAERLDFFDLAAVAAIVENQLVGVDGHAALLGNDTAGEGDAVHLLFGLEPVGSHPDRTAIDGILRFALLLCHAGRTKDQKQQGDNQRQAHSPHSLLSATPATSISASTSSRRLSRRVSR